MKRLEKYVKGKRVAFVGEAPNISGKGLGKEIDAFDVVIRTNNFPVKSEMIADYGKRCDIIMLHAKNTNKDIEGVPLIMTYFDEPVNKRQGVDYIAITQIERLCVSYQVKKEVEKEPKYGTQGTNIMMFCLEANCESFNFFGITGFQDLKGDVADHNSEQFHLNTPIKEQSTRKEHYWHNFEALNDHLRLYLSQRKITMDEYSLQYFKQK